MRVDPCAASQSLSHWRQPNLTAPNIYEQSQNMCMHEQRHLANHHWLHAAKRIMFKLATSGVALSSRLTFCWLHPSCWCAVSSTSSTNGLLFDHRDLSSTAIVHSLPIAGANLWNGLPHQLQSQLSFRRQLKTFLFCSSYLESAARGFNSN